MGQLSDRKSSFYDSHATFHIRATTELIGVGVTAGESQSNEKSRSWVSNAGIIAGPISAFIVYFILGGTALELEARCTAAIIAWMAVWWMTEAIPLAATALMPLVLFPILPVFPSDPRVGDDVVVQLEALDEGSDGAVLHGKVTEVAGEQITVRSVDATGSPNDSVFPPSRVALADKRSEFQRAATPFANKFIYLFLGGFLIALSIERWNLHRRIALLTLRVFGTSPGMIVAGFMAATALLSMWISNTATTVMMLPIAMSVVGRILGPSDRDPSEAPRSDDSRDKRRFATALMLGIAYAASIGGMASLVGTPPNALLAGFLSDLGRPISFARWMLFATPMSLLLLVITWVVLTKGVFRFRLPAIPDGKQLIRQELQQLGPLSTGERVTLVVFLLTAGMWIFRVPLTNWVWFAEAFPVIKRIDDSIVALIGGLSLFVIPVAFRPVRMTMNWEIAKRLPWGILLLFGGGLSLATGVQASGLGQAIGDWVGANATLSVIGMIFLIVFVVVYLTEFTSNMATTSLFLPILYQISLGIAGDGGQPMPPEYLLVPATLAASCAFMLPVATPPNAIVFASDRVTIPQMVKAGMALNILGILLLPWLIWLLGPTLLGF